MDSQGEMEVNRTEPSVYKFGLECNGEVKRAPLSTGESLSASLASCSLNHTSTASRQKQTPADDDVGSSDSSGTSSQRIRTPSSKCPKCPFDREKPAPVSFIRKPSRALLVRRAAKCDRTKMVGSAKQAIKTKFKHAKVV